jgi:hypothetical protein
VSQLQLTFPGCRFTLQGPESALRDAELLYHSSHLTPAAPDFGSPLAAGFFLERLDEAWRLRRNGEDEPVGHYEESIHALLAMEHAIETRLLEELGDGVALHAGAVVVDGAACLLMGRADSGKSSTTFQMVELGHPFLAEEIAVVDAEGRVRPHLQSVALDPRVVSDFRGAHTLEHGRLLPLDELLVRYLPQRVSNGPAPLETIVLPFYRPTSAARVESLGLEETLIELLGYCFEPQGDQELFIERLIELFTSARLLRLSYPHAAGARAALAELFGYGHP